MNRRPTQRTVTPPTMKNRCNRKRSGLLLRFHVAREEDFGSACVIYRLVMSVYFECSVVLCMTLTNLNKRGKCS